MTVNDIEAGEGEGGDVEMKSDSEFAEAPSREALEGIVASLTDLKSSFAAHIQEVAGLKSQIA